MGKIESFLSFLVPPFLSRLDRYFLLNNRLLWISKIHYVLFYALVGSLAMVGFAFAYPIMPANIPNINVFLALFLFLSIIPASLWVKSQMSYNIEGNFGIRFPFLVQFRWFINLLSFSIFLSIPFLGASLLEWRVANTVHTEQLVNDINTLNIGNGYFPTNNYGDNIKSHAQDTETYYNFTRFTPVFHYENNIIPKDLLNENELENLLFVPNTTQLSSKLKQINEFMVIFQKYGGQITQSPRQIYDRYERFVNTQDPVCYEQNFEPLALSKDIVYQNIRQIVRSKYKQNMPFHDTTFVNLLALVPFFLALLLHIYQSVGLRTMFISAVSLIFVGIGSIFTTIVFEKSFGTFIGESGTPIFILGVLSYLFVSVQALLIFNSKRYSFFKTICLVLSAVGTPFILAWTSVLFYKLHIGYIFHYDLMPELSIGVVFYLVLALPIFRALFIKVQSMPK